MQLRIVVLIAVLSAIVVTSAYSVVKSVSPAAEASSILPQAEEMPFAPSGAKWQEVSRDRPVGNVEIVVSRVPLSTGDGWIYRCISGTGSVSMLVVPDDDVRSAKYD